MGIYALSISSHETVGVPVRNSIYVSIHTFFCTKVGCSNTSKRFQDMNFIFFQQYKPPKSKRAQPKAEKSLASAHTPRRPHTVLFVKYIPTTCDNTCSSKPSWLSTYLPLGYVTAASSRLKWPFRAQQQGEEKKLHVSAYTTALLTTACAAQRTRRS